MQQGTYCLLYVPLLIRLKCCETVHLPPYLGSTIHGVVGWKLSAYSPQAYRYLFENRRYSGGRQDIVNPYILEPPRAIRMYRYGDVFSFRLILIGSAQEYVRDVVSALTCDEWYEIGAQRAKFKILDIIQSDTLESIWRQGELNIDAAVPEILTASELEGISRCSIHFLTPLRIRRAGDMLKDIDFQTIIRNITRRVDALTERYGGYADRDAISSICEQSEEVYVTSSGLYWHELKRYSNRRNTKMDFGGLLGAMTLEGDLSPFTPWLQAARVLHIGRNVTFGFGQVDVVFC